MERAAEVKLSARCSEEPVAGDGSMCAVSITERAKLDEPEAADGITGRSPKPLAVDGVGITKKRPRKPEEPPKKEKGAKEKGAEEKIKRSKKKRAVEKNKQPNNVEVVHEKIMTKAEEKRNRSNQEKRIEEMLMRIEKIASKVEENKISKEEKQPNQVEVVKSLEEQVMTELVEKSKKKKKLVTQEINQAEIGHYLSDEVWSYVMSIGVFTFEDCAISEIEMSSRDPSTEAIRFDARRMCIENQANLLRQYRTNGHVVLQYEVPDHERDVDVEV